MDVWARLLTDTTEPSRTTSNHMVSFELDNGEAMHAAAPATFYLPSLGARTSLKPGDIVKLVFRIEHDGEVDVERMWVIVRSTGPNGYVGALDNQPSCTDELELGTLVQFGPEHVIQVHQSS